jgi:hypothetical protein
MKNRNRKKPTMQDKNPYDSSSVLYKRLTKLWSSQLSTLRDPKAFNISYDRLTHKKFKSASNQEFKREDKDHPLHYLMSERFTNAARAERYVDFEQMEYFPEAAAALDIYANEIATYSEFSPPIKIKTNNLEVKETLDYLFYDILNVENNLYSWVRTLVKYGDMFLYLDTDASLGVKDVTALPTAEIERLEGEDETNPSYVQFQWNRAGMTFENGWQIVHFRLLGNDKFFPYGTSVLDPARRIWRQLDHLENAMMSYRIVRSPERKVFYLDVGGLNDEEIKLYIEQVRNNIRRSVITDSNSGRSDLRYNAWSSEEDFIIPVRGQNSATKIDQLSGGQFTGVVDDIKYLRDKFFSALKIPAAYLSQDNSEDRQSLAQKDLMFAKTVLRLQNAVISGLYQIAITHLYILGFRNSDLINFKISLNNPSKIAEMQELEQFKTRCDIAASMNERYFSNDYVYRKVFNMPDDEIIREKMLKVQDIKFELFLSQFSGEGATDMGSALGGGDMSGMGDLGSMDIGGGLGGMDLGGGGESGGPEVGGLGDIDLGDIGGEAEAETPTSAEPDQKRGEAAERLMNPNARKDRRSTDIPKSRHMSAISNPLKHKKDRSTIFNNLKNRNDIRKDQKPTSLPDLFGRGSAFEKFKSLSNGMITRDSVENDINKLLTESINTLSANNLLLIKSDNLEENDEA